MTTVVLLGSNGQLGSDILKLSDSISGINIIAINRSHLDLSDTTSIGPFFKNINFDVLINCASYNRVDDAENYAELAYSINSYVVRELSNVCAYKNARLVQISTDYVFDGMAQKPYCEFDEAAPINVYGASKLLGENFAALNHNNSLIVRVASLFGIAGSSGKGGNFVEAIIKKAVDKGFVEVVSDITMSPTSTLEVAKVLLKIVKAEVPVGIYNLVNSGQATWYQFAEEIVKKGKIRAEIVPISSGDYVAKARRPSYSVLDNSKIVDMLGTVPHWTEALDLYLYQKGYAV